jgi:hypothetical protein
MMKQILMLAGVAALTFAGPVVAKPGNGHGNGRGHVNGYGVENGRAYGVRGPVGYGVGGCPPGLAKKAVPCMPPGQARKLYGVGDQVPLSASNLLSYNALPRSIRSHRSLNPRSRFITSNGYVYEVNPRTRVVTDVVRTRR